MTPTLEDFREAASTVPTFDDVPWTEPVPVGSEPARDHVAELVERFVRHGFAIAQLDPASDEDVLAEFADALGIGPAFVPPLYRTAADSAPPTVSRISAARNAGTADAAHPSFGRTSGQRLHCDGTLQAVGEIRTTLLLCQAQGISGGETLLFNSPAAFVRLLHDDPAAAVALATPGVLVRQANINGRRDENRLAAFTVLDSRLVTAFSQTETDRWEVPEGIPEDDVRRGVEYLEACTRDPELYRELTLEPGQLFILSNAELSHGRAPYVDSAQTQRCMLRSLHTELPALATELSVARGQ